MGISEWIAIGELLVAVIGIIVGCIGGKELKKADKLKNQFGDLKAKIEKLEISNSQIAQTINNNGINLKDADYLVNKVVDEKTKNKPDIYFSEDIPQDIEKGSLWISD